MSMAIGRAIPAWSTDDVTGRRRAARRYGELRGCGSGKTRPRGSCYAGSTTKRQRPAVAWAWLEAAQSAVQHAHDSDADSRLVSDLEEFCSELEARLANAGVSEREPLRKMPRVDARHERIARNEAMYRAVNRELEQASEDAGGGAGAQLEILCECGEPACNTMLTLTIGEYDEAHGQPDRFIVAVEHEDPQMEQLVIRRDHYLVVDKFGEAERIAVTEEQRRGA
jgi:hypothetical protein